MRNQTSFRLTTTLLPTDTTAKTTTVINKVDADGNQFYPTFSEETVVLTNDDKTIMETTRATCTNGVLTFVKRGLSDDSSATVVDNRKLTWNPGTIAFVTAGAGDWIDKDDDITWTGNQTYSGNATFSGLLTTNKGVKYPSFADVTALNAYADPFGGMFAVVESTGELYRYNDVTEEWSLVSTAEISEDVLEFIREVMDGLTMPYMASKVIVGERYTASDSLFLQYAPMADDSKMGLPVGDAATRTQIHIQRISSRTASDELKLKMRKVGNPTTKVVVEIQKGTVVNDTNEDYWHGNGTTIATAELAYTSFSTDWQEVTFTFDNSFGGGETKQLLSVVVHQQDDIVNASNYYEMACDITQYSEGLRAVQVENSTTRTTTKVMPYCDSAGFDKCILARQDDTLYSMPYKFPILENTTVYGTGTNAGIKLTVPIRATSIQITGSVSLQHKTAGDGRLYIRNGNTGEVIYYKTASGGAVNEDIDQAQTISENDSVSFLANSTANNGGFGEIRGVYVYALNGKITKTTSGVLAKVSEVVSVGQEVNTLTMGDDGEEYFMGGEYNGAGITLDYQATTTGYLGFEAPCDGMLYTLIASDNLGDASGGKLFINGVAIRWNTVTPMKKGDVVYCNKNQSAACGFKFISN